MPPPRHGSGSTPSSANDWAPDVNSHGHAALRMTVTAIGRWSPHRPLSRASQQLLQRAMSARSNSERLKLRGRAALSNGGGEQTCDVYQSPAAHLTRRHGATGKFRAANRFEPIRIARLEAGPVSAPPADEPCWGAVQEATNCTSPSRFPSLSLNQAVLIGPRRRY
jgi:hypothetical protein